MSRYFLYLAYDGTAYHGWQIQPNGLSVQEQLMKALSTLLRYPVEVTGAGRTDAGVHARLMVAHFDTDQPVEPLRLTDKLNRILPPDMAIYKVVPVQPQAHARFDATYRTYEYYITTAKSPFQRHYSYRLFHTPDFERMNQAAALLLNHTDFTSFSKLHTDVKTNNCRVMQARWDQIDANTWRFTIQADRFLRNMVRAVVGTLLQVGQGKLTVEGFNAIILQRNRCSAGTSVPGEALFLVDIGYPSHLFLPMP